jgi:hypothetical protein
MSAAEFSRRWEVAAHAMQSGVAMEINDPDRQFVTEPKHLRVGVNAALVDHGSLVKLLVAKGVITDDEYLRAIAEGMEREKADYEKRLSDKLGRRITLG